MFSFPEKQLSYLLSSETDTGLFDVDNSNSLKELDFSVGLGIGYQVDDVMLGVRYNLGITDTSDNSDDNLQFPNRVVQVSLGFMF